jgi:hypothetical protein
MLLRKARMTSASTSNSPIHLGLTFELEPEQLFTLERHFLPLGKVGGFPAWLNPATVPQSAQLECAVCHFNSKKIKNSIFSSILTELRLSHGFSAANLLHRSAGSSARLSPSALRVRLPERRMFTGELSP